MKKNILGVIAFVAALVVALPSQAQIKFGIKGGLNMNKVSVSSKGLGKIDSKNTTGFFVGPTADVTIPLAGLGADVSLLYDQRKMKVEDYSKTLHYISVPINAKYTVGFSSLASVYLATGPQFSFNVGDRKFGKLLGEEKDDFFKLSEADVAWNIGAGATVLSHLRVGYNYSIPLTNSFDGNQNDGKDWSLKMKNCTHQVSVTYLF